MQRARRKAARKPRAEPSSLLTDTDASEIRTSVAKKKKKPKKRESPVPKLKVGRAQELSRGTAGSGGETDEEEAADSSNASLSSGLSPRGKQRLSKREKFDYKKANEALAFIGHTYHDKKSARIQGGDGSYVDDLQIRLAYQQLNTLSGMAGKVQNAIVHNKKIFEKTVSSLNLGTERRVFTAWRGARYGTVAKQQKLRRAINRIARGKMTRTFMKWRERAGQIDPKVVLQRKASRLFRRGLARRTLWAWLERVEETFRKEQERLRDLDLRRLHNRIRWLERRAIHVFDKKRLAKVFYAWDKDALTRHLKHQKMRRVIAHYQRRRLLKGWNSWYQIYYEKARHKRLVKKALARMRQGAAARALGAWGARVQHKKDRHAKLRKAVAFMQKTKLKKGLNSMKDHVWRRKRNRKIVNRWKRPHLSKASSGWLDRVLTLKRQRLIVRRSLAKLARKQLVSSFWRWAENAESSRLEREGLDPATLTQRVVDLKEDNQKLQKDNERFVRLIDSGEWGKSRINELMQAGELLRTERETLSSLLTNLKSEYKAVQSVKNGQEEEIRNIKDRMLGGNFVQRNKMMVKGASSFNALVRALKQDLIDAKKAGAPVTEDPNVLFEIDQLSMDKVTVFPDGELSVQAVSSERQPFDDAPAMEPLKRIRKPKILSGGGSRTRAAAGRGGGAAGGVVNALQALSPAEVDKLEEWIKSEAAAARPAGLMSSTPLPR